MKTVIRYSLLLLLLAVLSCPVVAQERFSEAEVNQEKMFIEANREKLLGHFDKAITILRELHRQQGDNAAITYELGRLLQAEGQLEEAIRYLQLATTLDPANEWYPKFLADIYQQEGRNAEGAALYEKLVQNSPNDEFLYFRWAYFLVRAQQVDKALKVYDELEKRVGLNEEIARRKHTLYLGMGDTKRASRELERLAEAFPTAIAYQHLLADFYESQGDTAAARKVYERIISQNPSDPQAQLALAGGSNVQNDELRYLADLQPAFERSDVPIDQKISKLYPFITKVAATGDRELADAALLLTQIMEVIHSNEAKPFAAAGDLYYHSGRPQEAIAKYRETLERDENVFPVWEQLLVSLYETGDTKGLYQTANAALDVFPNRAIIQYYLAIAAIQQGNYTEALDAISLAELMSGRDPELLSAAKALAGEVYSYQKKAADAAAAFAKALTLAPRSPEVNYRYSQYMLAQNQLPAAKNAARIAVDAASDNPYYAYGMARILYEEKAYDQAEQQLAEARKNGARYWASALELSGDVQFQLNQVEKAVEYWQQAKVLAGANPRLDIKITNRSL